jgi:hypothetical protein
MPESLARVEPLNFLNSEEKRVLNQIRGNAYLTIFGLVEEFILPFVLDHARPQLQGDDYRVRALLKFAGEEAKHIQLFKRFRQEFEEGFGTECPVIGPPRRSPPRYSSTIRWAVAITTLHIEWMVQSHYVDSVRDNQNLDPQFKSLLKHHWLEEVQHAKLDTLMVEALAKDATKTESCKASASTSTSAGSSTAVSSNRSNSIWTAWNGPSAPNCRTMREKSFAGNSFRRTAGRISVPA